MVASESKVKRSHISRRLNLLRNYYNADILHSPTKVQTKESAVELLSEVYFLGPIGAVFVLPSPNNTSKTSDVKAIQYLDTALRTTAPKAILVNFLRNSAGICQRRVDAGFQTFNVQWQQSLDFNCVFRALDKILNLKSKNVLIKDDKLNDSRKGNIHANYKSKIKSLEVVPNTNSM